MNGEAHRSVTEDLPPQLASRLTGLRTRSQAWSVRVLGVGFAVTAVLSGLAYWLADRRRADDDAKALVDVGVPVTASLALSLARSREVVSGIAGFVNATGEGMSGGDFAAYVAPILERYPHVYAIEWAELVEPQARASFRERTGGLELWEPDGEGRRPAGRRPIHAPIVYEQPTQDAVGLDLTFEPGRAEVIRRAMDSDDLVLSPPFRLAEAVSDGAFALAIYRFVRLSETSKGLAIIVIRVSQLIEDWVEQSVPDDEVAVWLEDIGPEGRFILHGTPLDEDAQRVWIKSLPFGDRTWRVGATVPRGYAGGGQLPAGAAVATLLLGLMGTLVAAGAGRIRNLGREVEKALELGQYVVERKLGEGAMGVVFLAHHSLMKRPTALKLMLDQSPKSVARFEREVQLSCKLSHPNVVALYDFGRTEDGVFYYAMEYLDGIDLSELVREQGPVADGRAVHFLTQLARGLREAHAAGLVHRDVKPGNVVITRSGAQFDLLKILDFGLVKEVEEAEAPDRGRIVGTPLYMSPEAITAPDSVGPPADVYAVGCMAFFLLAGRPPFTGRTVGEILDKQKRRPPPLLSDVARFPVDPLLVALVSDCMAKDPGARPVDGELVARLEAMTVCQPWTEEHAAKWWSERSWVESTDAGEETSVQEVTVLTRRRRGLDPDVN